MQINELAVLEEGQEFQFTRTPYAFHVTIVHLGDGRHTWRGVGQRLPQGEMAGIARLLFEGDDDRCDEWPLDIHPVAIELLGGVAALEPQDFARLEWEPCEISWSSDGRGNVVAAQFQHRR